MMSAYTQRLADSLTADQKRVLLATPTRGQSYRQTPDGDGQARYELKRKGLLTMTRPVNDVFFACRSAVGDEVAELVRLQLVAA